MAMINTGASPITVIPNMEHPMKSSYQEGTEVHTLEEYIDDICTLLEYGELWHKKSANECRELGIRGPGRWHEAEADGDNSVHMGLRKILEDRVRYVPKINIKELEEAEQYKIKNLEAYKMHFMKWIEHEKKLIHCLNKAVAMSRDVDSDLYEKLWCIKKESENEKMRVKMVQLNFDFADWNKPYLLYCSRIIHKYFEHEYKQGDMIDFNLG